MKSLENLKKIIIIVVVIIIIIGILLFMMKNSYEKVYEEEDIIELEKGNEIPDIKLEKVTNPTMFYSVANCVNTYLHDISTASQRGISMIDQEEVAMTEEERLNRIYNQLSIEYIKENNITISNVRQYVHSSENYYSFYPIGMNVIRQENSLTETYGAYGRIRNTSTDKFVGDIYIVVIIDNANMTYAIKPVINQEISSLDELDLTTNITSVEKNENNVFSYERVNDETLVKKYINTYRMYAVCNPEIAYEYLDGEYRNVRFGNLENYRQYMQENQNIIGNVDKYQKTIEDGYTQYVCIDTNGNYYIFRETATMQYSLLLDTYTIDIPEFTDKYNQADNETKVGMNIEKIKSALNAKDYNYIYSKLADSFKGNYFPTVDSLKQYLSNTFFDKNTVEYESVDNQGKNYMFDIKFNDATNTSSQVVSKRIIMQLKEGTDFVFSFNV